MRAVVATLLAAAIAALAVVAEPGSFLIAMVAILLGFLLAAARAAVDLVDLIGAELTADAVALLALGTALARVTTGNAVLIGTLLVVALTAQGFPRAVTMARCLRRSTSPPTPPGSA